MCSDGTGNIFLGAMSWVHGSHDQRTGIRSVRVETRSAAVATELVRLTQIAVQR
jgi:hypothetical protein